MEILALLGLAYVSTVLNTQIISEHEKEAIKKEKFFSFPFFKQTSKKQTKQSNIKQKNSKNVDRKVGEKKVEKKVEKKKERGNNYIQYPVKLDNDIGKITPLDDYYKFNENRRIASKYPTPNGLNIEYDQTWAPIKNKDMTYGVLNKKNFNQY
jgi:hypothetical protein